MTWCEDLRPQTSRPKHSIRRWNSASRSAPPNCSKSTEQLRAEIAQREQTEEELLRARKLESLGVLAGGIAHDFNNFLTVVQGNIEVAKAH